MSDQDVTAKRIQIAQWRSRAEEARANAQAMAFPETREIYERLAQTFDRMADTAETFLTSDDENRTRKAPES